MKALRQFAPALAPQAPHRRVMQALRRFLKGLAVGFAVMAGLFGVIQLVPYGRTHSNPPVVAEPRWDSPRTRELAVRACFDCHSNETKWPWYANVAPMSWTLARDVDGGRSVLNFSEWDGTNELATQSGSSVIRRDMPPRTYVMAHESADLTDDEKIELARGLHATFGTRVSVD